MIPYKFANGFVCNDPNCNHDECNPDDHYWRWIVDRKPLTSEAMALQEKLIRQVGVAFGNEISLLVLNSMEEK